MRILVASPYLPWPLNSGGNAAQFSTLQCLADDHEFTLVSPVFTADDVANAQELQRRLPKVKVRGIPCWEVPPTTPVRIGILQRTFGRALRAWQRLLEQPGIAVPSPVASQSLYYPFRPLHPQWVNALAEEIARGVDLCQCEFSETLSLGAWIPNNLPRIFVQHQVHFIYARRLLDTLGRDAASAYLETTMRRQEESLLQDFDAVVAFSEADRQAMLGWVPPEKVFTSPFPIPADVGLADDLPSRFDGRFLFVASEEHAPNRDALEWLRAEIWPRIRAGFPAARLEIIGRWSEPARARLADAGFHFAGFVPDLGAALRGGILLVPLRIGSGIRVKIMAAMGQGVPVVTTGIGCEGMPVRNGESVAIRDAADGFAQAALEVAGSSEIFSKLSRAGRAVIQENYTPDAVRRRRNEIYYHVKNNFRSRN